MIAVLVYVFAIVIANLSVATFGPMVTPINAFLFIGLDFALRDTLHEKWKHDNLWLKMLALIVVSGLISYGLNPASRNIAIASVAAFVVANFVDALVYQLMLKRSYLQRSNASNCAAAASDTVVFQTMAFGGVLVDVMLLQFLAKVLGGALWSAILNRYRKFA